MTMKKTIQTTGATSTVSSSTTSSKKKQYHHSHKRQLPKAKQYQPPSAPRNGNGFLLRQPHNFDYACDQTAHGFNCSAVDDIFGSNDFLVRTSLESYDDDDSSSMSSSGTSTSSEPCSLNIACLR